MTSYLCIFSGTQFRDEPSPVGERDASRYLRLGCSHPCLISPRIQPTLQARTSEFKSFICIDDSRYMRSFKLQFKFLIFLSMLLVSLKANSLHANANHFFRTYLTRITWGTCTSIKQERFTERLCNVMRNHLNNLSFAI